MLKQRGLLDTRYKPIYMCDAAEQATMGLEPLREGYLLLPLKMELCDASVQATQACNMRDFLVASNPELSPYAVLGCNKSFPHFPYTKQTTQNPFLQAAQLLQLPSCPAISRWEQYGQCIIIDADQLTVGIEELNPDWLHTVCSIRSASWIVRRLRIQQNLSRSPQMQILYSNPSPTIPVLASVRQNNIIYSWYPLHTMFSPGNISEKLRISHLQLAGETILDLYAGIGYWVLPMLVHGGAEHVYAVDMNPHSIESLRTNLISNNIPPSKCTIICGDNRVVAPIWKGRCDRVMLGLLPSSQDGWDIAIQALRVATGGILHVHENIVSGKEDEFIQKLSRYICGNYPAFDCTIEHCERVKSYAPLVYHWVFDVRVMVRRNET